jgi:hypothetical protein
MTKTAFLLTLIITTVASMPAHAQPLRVFVSGLGLDTNPCTVTQPCRTFQHAQFGGITASCSTCNAVTVSVTTSDPVTLNGLLLDGSGTGQYGILITSGPSVQILNSVVRHFQYGIQFAPSIDGSSLLIEDTIASDSVHTAIVIAPSVPDLKTTLNRITANNNAFGVFVGTGDTMIANSMLSNNSNTGLIGNAGAAWLAKSVISGNPTGVFVGGAIVRSYGDNYIADNVQPVTGNLTPVSMQ